MFAPEDPIRWVTETDGKRWRLGRPDAVERFEEGLAELECNLAQGSTVTGDRLAHIGSSLEWGVEALTEESVDRCVVLYRLLVQARGTGKRTAEEGLLFSLLSFGSETLVPFWREMLDFERPRDPLSKWRREWFAAALAWLVKFKRTRSALDALVLALAHDKAATRLAAARALRAVFSTPAGKPPRSVGEAVREVAERDRAFLARFHARLALLDWKLPVPNDNPGAVYVFDVFLTFQGDFVCQVAVASRQTLGNLHIGIQQAFGWGMDHAYAFFLSGKRRDRTTTVSQYRSEFSALGDHELSLGQLGLKKGQRFLYLFDFGDNHEFNVRVVDVLETAEPGTKYPKTLSTRGSPPKQYPSWEE